jgi:hypothetical protein
MRRRHVWPVGALLMASAAAAVAARDGQSVNHIDIAALQDVLHAQSVVLE